MKNAIRIAMVVTAAALMFAQAPKSDAPVTSIEGYLRDAGCVYRFHEVVKPLPNGCLQACVRAGSPLVVLTRKEEVYQPISSEIPDADIRSKLLPHAGKLVKITGRVYQRGSSKAITVEHIEELRD